MRILRGEACGFYIPSRSPILSGVESPQYECSCGVDLIEPSNEKTQALDHDWIDHAPPQVGKETDWFPLQCLYAIVISSAAKTLYNQRALRQSLVEREQKLETAYKLLEGWRSHLPAPLQDIHKHDVRRILDDHQVRHIALSMFRQYHEAIFILYFPWTGSQSDGRVSENCRRKSMELCVNSAQVVLAITNQISSLDILDR